MFAIHKALGANLIPNLLKCCQILQQNGYKYQKLELQNITLLHRPRLNLWKIPEENLASEGRYVEEVFVRVTDLKVPMVLMSAIHGTG